VFASEGQKFFAQIEKTYKCAGLCEKGLFYVSKPISEGVPEQRCVKAYADQKADSDAAAAAPAAAQSIVVSFVALVAFMFSMF